MVLQWSCNVTMVDVWYDTDTQAYQFLRGDEMTDKEKINFLSSKKILEIIEDTHGILVEFKFKPWEAGSNFILIRNKVIWNKWAIKNGLPIF